MPLTPPPSSTRSTLAPLAIACPQFVPAPRPSGELETATRRRPLHASGPGRVRRVTCHRTTAARPATDVAAAARSSTQSRAGTAASGGAVRLFHPAPALGLLGDPTRRAIFELLARRVQSVSSPGGCRSAGRLPAPSRAEGR